MNISLLEDEISALFGVPLNNRDTFDNVKNLLGVGGHKMSEELFSKIYLLLGHTNVLISTAKQTVFIFAVFKKEDDLEVITLEFLSSQTPNGHFENSPDVDALKTGSLPPRGGDIYIEQRIIGKILLQKQAVEV